MNEHYPHYPPPAASWYALQAAQAGAPGLAPAAYQPPPANLYAAYQSVPPVSMYQSAPAVAYAPMPAAATSLAAVPRATPSLLSSSFVKGALIGAVAAYLLTNEKLQQGAIKTSVKAWSMLQGGVEEMKERFRDAEAELHAAEVDEE